MADRDSGSRVEAAAATTALVVATRAAVDRCGPDHIPSPLSPHWDRRRPEGNYTATIRETLPPQPELFELLFDEEMVEQLVDFLQFFEVLLPVVAEQVIHVPKIIEDIPLAEQLLEVPQQLVFDEQTVDFQFRVVVGRRGERLRSCSRKEFISRVL